MSFIYKPAPTKTCPDGHELGEFIAQETTVSLRACGYESFADPYEGKTVKPISIKITYKVYNGKYNSHQLTVDVLAYYAKPDAPEAEMRMGGDLTCGYIGQTQVPGTPEWVQALVEQYMPDWFRPAPSFVKQG